MLICKYSSNQQTYDDLASEAFLYCPIFKTCAIPAFIASFLLCQMQIKRKHTTSKISFSAEQI